MEEVIVIAVIALLVAFGIPAVRSLFKSLEARGGGRAMISATLSSARAIAAKEQSYAGVRFQHAYFKDDPAKSPLKMPQYMIFIIYDSELPRDSIPGNLGCRAVEGLKPIKLPEDVGIMEVVGNDNEIDGDDELIDKTTFSIIFSPNGKLVIHKLWIINRDGAPGNGSKDDIFNTDTNADNGIGMFLQDDYPSYNLDTELSIKRFRIYDRKIFENIDKNDRWSKYLKDLEIIYINPYTGTMIDK